MLVAQGLTKTYGTTDAVKDVDLRLDAGRVVGLVGANGAGKTTTIKMLAGLVEPTAGSVLVDGAKPTKASTRSRIGYLPEDSPLYEDETAVSYLRFFGGLYGMSRQQTKARTDELLGWLRLEESHWKKPIGNLSKGQKRKVAIARCLLHDPPVVLLDEPTSGLDPFTSREVETAVRQMRDDGKAVLLSAHNLAQVEELCDEILIVHHGRLATRGTLTELRERWGTQHYVVRGTVAFPKSKPDGSVHVAEFDRLADVETAMQAIRDADGIVLEVQAAPPSLKDILQTAAGE